MTPLKSLRAWSLISVNFLIYCVPDLSLSCTNLNLGYPETFSVGGSPIEPCTYPTWRFRQEPGGEMQMSPLACSCMGKWQQGSELSFSKDLCQWMARLKVVAAGGEHPSPKLSQNCIGLILATGADGRLTHLLQSLDFKETGGKNKDRKTVPGIPIVSEHPRQFRPRQVLLVPCDKWEQEFTVGGYQLLKAKTGDWGKDKTSGILI